jgi:hypothetical protein
MTEIFREPVSLGLIWQKYLAEHIFAGHYPSVRHETEFLLSLRSLRFNRRRILSCALPSFEDTTRVANRGELSYSWAINGEL